jgi:acyl-CoA thioesterase-1
MKKIIFFGDSLMAGYGLKSPARESVPALIAEMLLINGMEYETVNASVSGDTTYTAKSRIITHLGGDLALFVLELGANDFLKGFPPVVIEKNLQYLIDQIRKKFPELPILLVGITLPNWAPGGHTQGYAHIFSNLSKKNGLPLVASFLDGVMGEQALNMQDGVHPLAAGYKIAAANIWPFINKILFGQQQKK